MSVIPPAVFNGTAQVPLSNDQAIALNRRRSSASSTSAECDAAMVMAQPMPTLPSPGLAPNAFGSFSSQPIIEMCPSSGALGGAIGGSGTERGETSNFVGSASQANHHSSCNDDGCAAAGLSLTSTSRDAGLSITTAAASGSCEASGLREPLLNAGADNQQTAGAAAAAAPAAATAADSTNATGLLFFGTLADAYSLSTSIPVPIAAVVSCLVDRDEDLERALASQQQQQHHPIAHHYFFVDDIPSTEERAKFSHKNAAACSAITFIHNFLEQGQNVYVHCEAGRTRSASLVLLYLIVARGWTFSTALALVQSQRQIHIKSTEPYLRHTSQVLHGTSDGIVSIMQPPPPHGVAGDGGSGGGGGGDSAHASATAKHLRDFETSPLNSATHRGGAAAGRDSPHESPPSRSFTPMTIDLKLPNSAFARLEGSPLPPNVFVTTAATSSGVAVVPHGSGSGSAMTLPRNSSLSRLDSFRNSATPRGGACGAGSGGVGGGGTPLALVEMCDEPLGATCGSVAAVESAGSSLHSYPGNPLSKDRFH